jgi:hypothetical protein
MYDEANTQANFTEGYGFNQAEHAGVYVQP